MVPNTIKFLPEHCLSLVTPPQDRLAQDRLARKSIEVRTVGILRDPPWFPQHAILPLPTHNP